MPVALMGCVTTTGPLLLGTSQCHRQHAAWATMLHVLMEHLYRAPAEARANLCVLCVHVTML